MKVIKKQIKVKKPEKLVQSYGSAREIAEPELKPTGEFLSTQHLNKEGKIEMTDQEFVRRHGNLEDFAEMRRKIEKRKKEIDFIELPGGERIPGDRKLFGCPNCGRWFWLAPDSEGKACPFCNIPNYVYGGRIRLATKTEIKAWMEREKAIHEKWIKDAPKREAELAALNKRLLGDGKI